MKLSDKILLIFIIFVTILIVLVNCFIGGSLQQILILSGVIYIFTFLTTFVISSRFCKRIIKLTYKVEEMAAGDLSIKLKSEDKDEIGHLANALDELMSRLQTGVAINVTKHKEISHAKTDFIALASHQLRTPLSIIKWYVDFLIAGDAGKFNKEQGKYLNQVYKSNERLIELVNALLDVSRIDLGTFSIDPEPTDLLKKAESAIEKFMPEIKAKKIELRKEFDKLSIINLDPRLTKIVFENIVSNAVKYTPERGIIRIVIKKIDQNILIKISDTGCGVPREQQPKIFTKLFRADNVRKMESIGTGLGLYIVKAIIEKSGGKIWFESPSLDLILSSGQKSTDLSISERDKGTTIFITIPLRGMKKKAGTKKLAGVG